MGLRDLLYELYAKRLVATMDTAGCPATSASSWMATVAGPRPPAPIPLPDTPAAPT